MNPLKLICVGDEPGFTIGKEYHYEWISEKYSFNNHWILITNDFEKEIEHHLNEFVISMLPPSNIWVEYVGGDEYGLTNGKWYNLLDRGKASLQDEHYYFLDDNNKFVGSYRGRRFRDVSKLKHRNDKLIELGI